MSGGYWALKQAAGAVAWSRQAVRVAGPDAERYLQGQTSQDVARLGPGQQAWALVLQPQGRLDAFVRVYRAGPEEFVLDGDAGTAPALVERLLRFRLRTKAEIGELDWKFVAVRGPGAAAPASPPPGVHVIGFEWGGVAGYDLAGPSVSLPDALAPASAEDIGALMIEAGFPRHGAELDERTIPAEAGLVGPAVSFTKGCYTGQELVARIDSRGNNVPRRLFGLRSEVPLAPGDRLRSGEREVGRVTSVAVSPRLGPVALGYLARGLGAGDQVWAERGDGPPGVAAQVTALPM